MRRYLVVLGLLAGLSAACGSSVNVEQERDALLQRDRAWSDSAKDLEKFLSFFAPDASIYPPGMPIATGAAAIRDSFTKMASMPGFSIAWTPTKADVSANGDLGHTAGTYDLTMAGASEKGKYVTAWKKQADGQWMVTDDIFNADAAPRAPAAQHVMTVPGAVAWGDGPPSLPPGARMAVVSGDPTQAQPFVIRAQMPAGYKIAAHWHPTDENVTVLSGTVAMGMGDTFDQSAMKDLSTGGFVAIPADMRHTFMTRTAATIQVHGIGPFAVNYVNPADDPSQKKK